MKPTHEVIVAVTRVSWDYENLRCFTASCPLTNYQDRGQKPEGKLLTAATVKNTLILSYYVTTWQPQSAELDLTEIFDDLAVRYREGADPARLMPDDHFTIAQLRKLHEAIVGHPLDKDTFRRRVMPYLVPTGRAYRPRQGRPAELFMLASDEEGE